MLRLTDGFYAGVGRFFVWTVILGLLLNLGLKLGNRWLVDDASNPTPPLVVYSMGMVEYPDQIALRDVYSALTYPQMVRLLLESTNLVKECDIELGIFRETPVQWTYFQVDVAGFRWVENQAAFPPTQEVFSIYVFGGSTTFGYGVGHDMTIPSALQYWLNLNATKTVAVYNFAIGGVTSTQELALFQHLVQQGYVPNAAIFIDGLNDFNYIPMQRGEVGCDAEKVTQEKVRNTLICQPDEHCLPVQETLKQFWETDDTLNLIVPIPNIDQPNDDHATNQGVIDAWLANKTAIETLADEHGIVTLFVMQPVPVYDYDLSYHFFLDEPANPEQSQYFRPRWGYELWQKWYEAAQETNNVLNLISYGAEIHENLYADPIHYSPQMNQLLGLAISDDIMARGWLEQN